MSAASPRSESVPRRRPRSAVLLALAAVCALLAAAAYMLAVQTARGQRIDDSAFGNLSPIRNPRVHDATADLLRTISVASVALLGLAIMAFAAARRRLDLALAAGVLIGGANLTTQILKVALPRSDLLADGGAATNGSFPSGHVTVAMSLAMALVLVAPPNLRAVAAAAGTIYAAGVGVAVLALDWHRPSDVLGAYLVTTAWAALVAALARGGRADRGEPSRAARAAEWVIAALTVSFVGVVAAAAARRFDLLHLADDRAAFVIAAITVAVVAGGLMAALVALIRPSPDAYAGVPRPR